MNAPRMVAPQQSASLRILVVEDDADSRELFVELLKLTGEHEIAQAERGEEGLCLLRTCAFDLVVTDIGLPDLSGLEMLEQARREGLLDDASLVVCSAHQELQFEVRGRGACFIPKPLDTNILFHVIAERMAFSEGERRSG